MANNESKCMTGWEGDSVLVLHDKCFVCLLVLWESERLENYSKAGEVERKAPEFTQGWVSQQLPEIFMVFWTEVWSGVTEKISMHLVND